MHLAKLRQPRGHMDPHRHQHTAHHHSGCCDIPSSPSFITWQACANTVVTWSPTVTSKITIDPTVPSIGDGGGVDNYFRNSGIVVVGGYVYAVNGVHPVR